VIRPYGADAPLPADWPARRRWLLTASASLDTVQAAQQVAGALRQSFAALVENRLGPADIQLVLREFGELVALIEAIRGVPTP
jgi:hypothetical protein